MPRRLAPLLLLALITACTDPAPVAQSPVPSPTSVAPSPSPSVTPPRPSPPAAGDVVLAVGGGTKLALYRLRAGSTKAERVRTLVPPQPQINLYGVSLSAGPTPTTCAVWHFGPEGGKRFELRCYGWGDGEGAAVKGAGTDVRTAGISADGRRLAWANNELNPMLRVGRLADGQVSDVKAYVGDPKLPPGNDPQKSFSGRGAAGIAWAGQDALAITVGGESDEGSGLRRFVPGATQGGWLYREDVPSPTATRVYDGVRSATSTTAWALERLQGVVVDDDAPPQRAVEISLPTGRLKRVISEPAEGRYVAEVSGGSRAVVYATAALEADKERRVYVRWSGQARGAVVSGLPDSRVVVAGA